MQQPIVETGIRSANNAINNSLPPAVQAASVNPMQIILFVLAIVWITVMLVLIAYSIVSYWRLKMRVRTAVLVKDNIYTVENIPTAFVLGLIKPRIYLPIGLSELEQSYILRHEQTHIKRLDYIIKPIAFLVLCVHWFNPLAWLSFILMSRDMEMSCDEKVIAQLGSGIKKDYSTSLLSLSSGRRLINASPLAFGESNVGSRIKNVLNYKRPAFWAILITALLLAAAGIGLCANPDVQQDIDQNPKNLVASIGNTDKILVQFYKGRTNIPKDFVVKWINSVDWKEKALKPANLSPSLKIIISDKPDKEIWLFEGNKTTAAISNGNSEKYYSMTVKDYMDMTAMIYSEDQFTIYSENPEKSPMAPLEELKSSETVMGSKIHSKNMYIIAKNLEIIISSPKTSSNPGDYIREHKKEYDEIVKMGEDVLPELVAYWDSKHDLKGNVALAMCKEICPGLNIISSDSPNGKLRLETFGINTRITAGGLYPAEGIRLKPTETDEVLWQQIPGYYSTGFIWSPDGRYAAITNQARTYGETVVLDTKKLNTISLPGVDELIKNFKIKLTVNIDHPDSYFSAKQWVNNKIVKVEFKWTGQDDTVYTGAYDYDVVSKKLTYKNINYKLK
jgi:beta-lactamase regulating signal transducer with metallopeptidase domain